MRSRSTSLEALSAYLEAEVRIYSKGELSTKVIATLAEGAVVERYSGWERSPAVAVRNLPPLLEYQARGSLLGNL